MLRKLIALTLTSALFAAAGIAQAGDKSYEIRITNLTLSQVFSPVLVVTHRDSVSLFEPGEPAGPELAALAEAGDATPFLDLLGGLDPISDAVTTNGPVLPGDTAVVTVEGRFRRDVISVASMLVNSNDAFLALDNVALPRRFGQFDAVAYDAGSEPNNELCADIPGPACGGAGGSPASGGEGYVFVSPGISGGGDLDPSLYDWRNPVARITIERLRD